jgi:rhamnogalacturonan endolyase
MRSFMPSGLLFLVTTCALGAEPAVDLFRDDFSRYPPGPLTRPVGQINAAIEEYHYLPHRGVPLAPWANAICHVDAWMAGEEDGKPYVEQHLPPNHRTMSPKLFSPIFLTGEPEWGDYTVEVSLRPLSHAEMAGLVFRYHTNRHHYLFCLQGGKQARLALRLPLEKQFRIADWKELGTADFPYDDSRYYRLKVETRGDKIRCYVDDKLLITAESAELPLGKVGLAATAPARYQDFRVTVSPETKRAIDERLAKRDKELARLRADNPRPKLWKKFDTPQFGAGRNVRFGDLDGDGVPEMVIAQNIAKVDGGNYVEISCLTAVNLDGKVLWQIGKPDPRNGLLTADCPFQIHDIEGTGKADVVLVKDYKLQILDGRTGKLKKSTLMPKIKGYPKVPWPAPAAPWPHERDLGDSILFVNFSGKKGRQEIVVKDRYWNFWVFDSDLKLLWDGQGMLGHYPYPYAGKDGRDLLAIGYALWDGSGKQLWSLDQELKDHADSVAVGNFSGNPKEPPLHYYSCSDDGFLLVDHRGVIQKHHRVGHAQTATIGKFRPDLPGLQYAAINFWKNPGIISLFDHSGNILSQAEPIHSGCPMLPVNWRGDGQEFILLSGNSKQGGMIDGQMRRVVMFPDDGHPDLCAAVMDLTGDARDEIVLWDQDRVWIYTQDRPFAGDKIYTPVRNPDYNESNYRCTVSLPGWKQVKK